MFKSGYKKLIAIVNTLWDIFIAKLICSPLLLEKYKSLASEPSEIIYVWEFQRRVKTLLFIFLVSISIACLFLAWPPNKGEKAGEYRHIYGIMLQLHKVCDTGGSTGRGVRCH